MKLFKEIYRQESGQAFVLVLILLLVGMLIIAPLMAFMSTGLISARSIDDKTDEVYAADAGVEDAINKIVTDDAFIAAFDEGDSGSYTLTDPVNGEAITVTIYKNSLLDNLLGEDEYKVDRVHEGWIQLDEPTPPVPTGDGLEYSYEVNFLYDGNGSRQVESVGVFFAPISGDIDSITGPYDWLGTETGVMHFNFLQAGSPEKKTVSGGFTFLWRWEQTPYRGPLFEDKDGKREGSFSFKFTVEDTNWSPSIFFIYGTVKEEDVSYITNSPGYYEWLIEATAGDTTIRAAIIEENGFVDVLTWEIDPPA
jgi:hypothetical protein